MTLLPREKIVENGAGSLDDNELLAIILGKGSRKESVFALSQRLMRGFDREELLYETDAMKLSKSLSVSQLQASKIMACIELGKRFFRTNGSRRSIQKIEDVYELLRNMQYLKKEYVRGLYLNSRYKIIHDEIISIGSLDANILHPREIFRPAIEYGAYALILAHNHPSGDTNPSDADVAVTKKITEIGQLIQIPLLDHLIIGEGGFFSFSREKLMTVSQ